MINEEHVPERESISDALKKYKESRGIDGGEQKNIVQQTSIPKASNFSQENIENVMNRETDPDLMTSYEVVKLPSKGLFYSNKISEVMVEYMTSKDEDLLTTPSLIENGTVLDVLLKRKIKTKGINPNDLLSGDRNALILFLRTSSYGSEYSVQVGDPRTGVPFKTTVDLLKLKYKEVKDLPDDAGLFSVKLPMRKKTVKFKLLTVGVDMAIFKNAEAIMEAYNEDFSQYNTMRLKSQVQSIDGNINRDYINKFIDAMPALDALTIRKKIIDVSPDVEMDYEFTAKDGYKFTANLSIGVDFFFPNT